MPSKSKIKGNNFERETVAKFTDNGHPAKRAWGSNGQALGLHEEVDVLVDVGFSKTIKIQCKRRKKLPNFLGLSEHIDAVVFREDRGETYIMLPLTYFIELLE